MLSGDELKGRVGAPKLLDDLTSVICIQLFKARYNPFMAPKARTYTMPFEPMTIEHLGHKLYSQLPPVISELVSNAFDAESPKVEIVLPEGRIKESSEVVVRDFGHGMNADELQGEFLPIGRNRREASGSAYSRNRERRVTGRKGLGKLSGFGVATEIEVRAISSGSAVCLLLNFDAMQKWSRDKPGKDYEPQVVAKRTGATREEDGVEIKLRKMRRKTRIDESAIRHGIAQRLLFIGNNFEVLINGTPIGPGDRLRKRDCRPEYVWNVSSLPTKGRVADDLEVEGWIGFLKKASQVGRGIDIFASNKAIELSSFFNLSSTHAQFARSHVVGELHANFLDDDDDLAVTARNSVVWESMQGVLLQQWGQAALKWAFEEWVKLRKKEKEDVIIRAGKFNTWLDMRPLREQKRARKMVSILVEDPDVEVKIVSPLLEIIKSSVESVAFRDLVEELEDRTVTAATLLKLFGEWRIVEAREHLKLADGRVAALTKLQKFMAEGALEIQQVQPLFRQNTWLVDESWTEAEVELTYTKMLQRKFEEPAQLEEKNRRLDIFGIHAGGAATIVELKHPRKTLSRDDLNQIEQYVDWTRSQYVGTGPSTPKYARGRLIVGKLGNDASVREKLTRLEGSDIRVETFKDLYQRAKYIYGIRDEQLRKVAPEFLRPEGKMQSKKKTAKKKKTRKSTKK